jgi:hypothetical protein
LLKASSRTGFFSESSLLSSVSPAGWVANFHLYFHHTTPIQEPGLTEAEASRLGRQESSPSFLKLSFRFIHCSAEFYPFTFFTTTNYRAASRRGPSSSKASSHTNTSRAYLSSTHFLLPF